MKWISGTELWGNIKISKNNITGVLREERDGAGKMIEDEMRMSLWEKQTFKFNKVTHFK